MTTFNTRQLIRVLLNFVEMCRRYAPEDNEVVWKDVDFVCDLTATAMRREKIEWVDDDLPF